MGDKVMAYGDGVNWSGTAEELSVTMGFRVQFNALPQEVQFPVPAGQTSLPTATELMTNWNDKWPGQASMPAVTEPTVRFEKSGEEVTAMSVKQDSGAWLPLNPVTSVDGFSVKNV